MSGANGPVNGEYGTAVRRREDPPLIKGTGTYTDDMRLPGELHAAFVRAEVAHALLTSVDTSAAAQAPGVLGAFAASDFEFNSLPPGPMAPDDMLRPIIASERVRFQGELVAVVVAETRAQAVDAAELVVAEYDSLDVIVDPEAAAADGAT